MDAFLPPPAFTDFLQAAESFCLFIETEEGTDGKKFIQNAQKHLLKLYSLGVLLPTVNYEDESYFEFPKIEDTERKRMLQSIYKRTPFSYYWVTLNPVEIADFTTDIETATGDLGDDLSDIYFDLKEGLMAYHSARGGTKPHALWHLKFRFVNHCNDHCIEALYAMHHYLKKVT